MSKDDTQPSALSSVRTFQKDIEEEHSGVVLAKAPLTTPEGQPNLYHHDFHEQGDKKKPAFDVESAFNESHVQVGTIVTDKKRSRRSIGALLQTALSEWLDTTGKTVWDGSKKLAFLKPKEVPQVEVAEVRKNIIQEAAQYAKQAPHDDHAAVIQNIKTLAKDAEQKTGKPYVLKPPSEKKLVWDHTLEEKPEEKAVAVPQVHEAPKIVASPNEAPLPPITETVSRGKSSLASYAAADTTPAPIASPVPTLVVSPQAKTLIAKKPPTVLPRQLLRPEQSSYESAPQARLDLRNAVTRLAPEEKPEKPRIPTPTLPPESAPANWGRSVRELPHLPPIPAPLQEKILPPPLPVTSTPAPSPAPTPLAANTLPSSTPVSPIDFSAFRKPLFIGIALLAGSAGIFGVLMLVDFSFESPTQEVVRVTSAPSLITTDTQRSAPLPDSRSDFLNILHTQLSEAPEGVSQIYPVHGTGQGEVLATTAEILAVLDPKTSGGFLRSLKDPLSLGIFRHEIPSPFIIFHISNFDTAFAGMLEWEKEMSHDLSPFFGAPVTQTLLPREGATSSPPHFVDALTDNQSVRILYDETQKERIVYAFVTNNVLIVTTNTEALSGLITRVK